MRHRSVALGAALRPLLDAGSVPAVLDADLADTLVRAASAHRLSGALRRALARPSDSAIASHLDEVQIAFTATALGALSRAAAAIQSLDALGILAALDGSPAAVFLVEWGEPAGSQAFGIVVEPADLNGAVQAIGSRGGIAAAPPNALTRCELCTIAGRAVHVLSPIDRLRALSVHAEHERWSTLDYLLAVALTARRCAAPDAPNRALAVSILAAEAVFGVETPLRAWAESDPGARSLGRSVAAAFGVDAVRLGLPAADGAPRKLVLHQHQAPGDLVMLSAAIRDLHVCYPGRFVTDVRTPAADLFANNPWITPIADDDDSAEHLYCEYPLIHRSNQTPVHFIWGFTEFLNTQLGLDIRPTAFKGDIHLSDAERATPSAVERHAGATVPYWIVAAGGKLDFTIKWWSAERFQQVVDHFRGRLLFVQVGEAGHYHPRLDGVLDLRGGTSLRELINLVHHADGVLTPVSLLMHLAAAVEAPPNRSARAAVVVAGGREPAHWEEYPGHAFLHTVGALPCCASGGCWRSRTLPVGDGDGKDLPGARCVDVVDGLPRCMDMISADDAIAAIERYIRGGCARPLTSAQLERVAPLVSMPGVETSPSNPALPAWCIPAPAVHTRAVSTTIAVVTFGDYDKTVERCLESIRQHCPRGEYRLAVGANGVSDASRAYLYTQRHHGHVDRLHESPENVGKTRLMRRMLADIDTPFIWWLDDDAIVQEPAALERRLAIANAAPAEVAVWGERWFYRDASGWSMAPDMYQFIRDASWYRGRPLPGEPGGAEIWEFIHGGCWLARMDALRAIAWPDPRIVQLHTFDDVLMSVALLQQDWELGAIGALGVSAGHEPRA